jgi:hypothetical protein
MEKIGGAQRFVIVLVALALALIAAVVAYPRYRAARELAEKKQGIAQALAKDAAFTETLLKMELESTGVTYKELLDFCDKSIDQRNTLIVEMRVNTTMLTPNTSGAIFDFLNAENGFARAKRAFFSASLELDTAQQAGAAGFGRFNAELARSKEASKRIVRGNQSEDRRLRDFDEMDEALASSKVYLDSLPLAAAKVQQALRNTAVSVKSFRAACDLLNSKEQTLAAAMSAAGMPFRPVFGPYYQRSIDKANEAEKKANV